MSKRIITVDGLALAADKEDIYSIIPGSDGYDYIVELDENRSKIWNLYNFIDDTIDKKNIIHETYIEHIDKTIDTSYKLSSQESEKDKIPFVIPFVIPVVKKILIKKTKPIPSHEEDDKDITQNVNQNVTLKKITLKPKSSEPPEKEPGNSSEKKLSKYHTFIKEFLAEHSDILWNERMKAANEAWKIHKELE